MNKITTFFLITTIYSCAIVNVAISQNAINYKISLEEYIESYKDVAIEHMHTYGIPASIKLAQAILESAFGNSDLAVNANNHFGIKCHNWQGKTMYKDDDEKNECFRKYDDPISSFTDHSLFLTTRQRYAELFTLEITDYKGWAHGLRKAGYATNTKYPELLINIIERNKLYEFDVKAQSSKPPTINEKREKETSKKPVVSSSDKKQRQVLYNNRIKYVIAKRNDTPESIANELGMGAWQIYRYNELERGHKIEPGQIIYLQPKRRRSFEHEEHIAEKGEGLYDISQKYGIKTRHLFRLNPDIHPDGILRPGEKISLQKSLFR